MTGPNTSIRLETWGILGAMLDPVSLGGSSHTAVNHLERDETDAGQVFEVAPGSHAVQANARPDLLGAQGFVRLEQRLPDPFEGRGVNPSGQVRVADLTEQAVEPRLGQVSSVPDGLALTVARERSNGLIR